MKKGYWVEWLLLLATASLWGAEVQITELPGHLNATLGKLEKGSKRLADVYDIESVPDELRGQLYVTIARGEWDKLGAGYSFRVNQPVTVYLAVQERGNPTLPEGWEQTFYRLEYFAPMKDGGRRRCFDSIWKKNFPAGKIEIPPHDGTDGRYFGVPNMAIVVPTEKPASTDTVTPIAAQPARPLPVTSSPVLSSTRPPLPPLNPNLAQNTTAPTPTPAAASKEPLRLPDAELKPGKLVEFKIPMAAKAWEAAKHLPTMPGETPLHDSDKNDTVTISLAVPPGFTPDKTWPLLICNSTANRPNSIMAGYFTKPGTETGWVVLAADASPIPKDDTTAWRWAVFGTALEYLRANWPGLTKWPVACVGFSGGAKRSGYFGAIMMRAGYHVIGMWMGGCNHDMATPGYQTYRPGNDFKRVPIFLSSGKTDTVATPNHHRIVMNSLKNSGFRNVRLETYDGGHKFDEAQAVAGLKWFIEESKH